MLATAVVVIAGTGVSQQRLLFPLTNRVSGYVGDISYSLYLWHFPVIILGTAVFGDEPLVLAALLGTAVLLAVYSFHLVEDPIRRSGWLTRRPRRRHHRHRRSFVPVLSRGYKWGSVSLLALVVLGLVATAAFRSSTTSTAAAPAPAVSLSAAPGQPQVDPAVAGLQTQIVAALQQTRWPKLNPTLDQAMDQTKVFDDVRLCGSSKRDADRCVWGDPSAGHTLVTVGNSLGVVYSRTLRTALGNDDDWRMVPDGMYGCPFGDPAVQPIAEDRSGGCAAVPGVDRHHQPAEARRRGPLRGPLGGGRGVVPGEGHRAGPLRRPARSAGRQGRRRVLHPDQQAERLRQRRRRRLGPA